MIEVIVVVLRHYNFFHQISVCGANALLQETYFIHHSYIKEIGNITAVTNMDNKKQKQILRCLRIIPCINSEETSNLINIYIYIYIYIYKYWHG